jgi:hypothetical protein
MPLYAPPAGIDDFSRRPGKAQALSNGWHENVVGFIANAKAGAVHAGSGLFYDQLSDAPSVPDSDPEGITWNGFPLFLTRWYATLDADQAEKAANDAAELLQHKASFGLYTKNANGAFQPLSLPYRRQDEYCEWYAERDNGKIKRIYFTAEPPEYWEFMGDQDISLVHELYGELLHNPNIPQSDLLWQHDVYAKTKRGYEIAYEKGKYNGHNKWNTELGAVHLTHWANSLGAEVQLASDGTLGWPVSPGPDGKTDPDKLMACAGFGGVNRSSDPRIGAKVFDFARTGLSVALANPIGLYMEPFDLNGLLDPKGNDVGQDCLHILRQSTDGKRVLRVEIAPPEGAKYVLGDCTLDGKKLVSGSQIARRITMVLYGIAKKIPGAKASASGCLVFECDYPKNSEFKALFKAGSGKCKDMKEADFRETDSFVDVPSEASIMSVTEEKIEPILFSRPSRRRNR